MSSSSDTSHSAAVFGCVKRWRILRESARLRHPVPPKTGFQGRSKRKLAIAKVLEKEGYLGSVKAENVDGKDTLTLELKYYQDKPVIERLERVSRPGLRIYKRADQLPVVQGGLGCAIVSTSRGVMTNAQARAEGHGGEVLCIVL